MIEHSGSTEETDSRRLFFGAQVEMPWYKEYPPGRLIPEHTRHVTLAFLGQHSLSKLQFLLPSIPYPVFPIGPIGIADQIVFLPPQKNRVVALEVKWFDFSLQSYQKSLSDWLIVNGYSLDQRPFYSHVTLARSPFDKAQWQADFIPLPLFVKAIHLYQSLGNLQYKSLWVFPLLPPFEELEHTADIAFLVRGRSPQELYLSAQTALAFKFPLLIDFFSFQLQNSLEDIIISLNESVGKADAKYGCPFKAVSFHGTIKTDAQNLLSWEMIVDV